MWLCVSLVTGVTLACLRGIKGASYCREMLNRVAFVTDTRFLLTVVSTWLLLHARRRTIPRGGAARPGAIAACRQSCGILHIIHSLTLSSVRRR